jgi:hypothetical protein
MQDLGLNNFSYQQGEETNNTLNDINQSVTGQTTSLNNIDTNTAETNNILKDINQNITGSTLNVKKELGSSATIVSIPAQSGSTIFLSPNVNRKTVKIFNDSDDTLYIAEAASASTTLYTYKLVSQALLIIDDTTGIISGIWDGTDGSAKVTETT